MTTSQLAGKLEFQPLSPERWGDFETLFGPNGGCGGCWCMFWRETRAEFARRLGEGNRQAMRELVEGGRQPGILAFLDGRPVGWCSVAPREEFGPLERSPVLKRIDDQPVWSIVCFFIDRNYRGRGLTRALIRAAIDHVRQQGGRVIEAYPTLPRGERLAPASSYMGLPEVFAGEGFVECSRPSASKLIMRYTIK